MSRREGKGRKGKKGQGVKGWKGGAKMRKKGSNPAADSAGPSLEIFGELYSSSKKVLIFRGSRIVSADLKMLLERAFEIRVIAFLENVLNPSDDVEAHREGGQ